MARRTREHVGSVHTPSGRVIEYGTGDGGKPLVLGGVPRAWLATEAHDGRGNSMTYSYCFGEADGYTAEFALDEIRYTQFDGDEPLAPSRAVQLFYGTKDPADVRMHYARGMELQSSLRLEEIGINGVARSCQFIYHGELVQTTLTHGPAAHRVRHHGVGRAGFRPSMRAS